MLKKSRKYSLLWLVVLMAALLIAAGCGGQDAGTGGDSEAPDVVKLGFLSPITGPNSAEGAAARNAFLMAIDAANASGEFPYTIEVIVIDDASKPEVGAAGAQQIVADEKVVAATGHWNSGVAEATIPIFKQAEIPLLIWGAIKEGLTSPENYPYITRSAPTAAQENEPLANILIKDMGYKKWFIVSDVTSYGEANTEVFTKILADMGCELLGTEKVQEGTVDFRPIIQKIKSSGATAVYFGGVVTEASLLKNQMHEAGMDDVLFAGISGIYSEDFLKIGAEAAEGALAIKPGIDPSKSPEGQKFLDDYAAGGYSEPVGAFTPYAYEAALILLNALKQCGDNPTPAAMVDAIKDSETTGIMGTTTFNEFGQTNNVAAYMLVVQDGKWVSFDESEYATGTRVLPQP
ncbi:MAG: branched-chain amino acid ABC transporter substrate-binding protein [Bacillota bacterium]|jgi:branched-chain amino acid transport system substrate-binding protein|nr:branched-chain amino acid ABC transporter substrate-binding protein [Clostridia bacterium]